MLLNRTILNQVREQYSVTHDARAISRRLAMDIVLVRMALKELALR
jgi:hypothetical protein